MKFFHLGDLHFGKTLHSISLIDEDQPFWVEQFLKAVDEYQVDAVVIAGDVYDTRRPEPQEMLLLDHLLTELAKRDKYVFVIPGNHDHSIRLSHMNELLSSHHIFIAGELRRELEHVTIPGTKITFWMMPYIFPKAVADPRVLNVERISTYHEAARALLDVQDVDPSACNILIAHQNVLANGVTPDHSASETIIGGVGEIDYTVFDAFDYVALGHIHNAQHMGRETVRYSGCPLYYDFSELHRDKSLTLVTVEASGQDPAADSKPAISIEKVKIPVLHELKQFEGTLEELLKEGEEFKKNLAEEEVSHYYVQCILQDKHVPPRAMEKLKTTFGNSLINIKREIPVTEAGTTTTVSGADGKVIEKLSLEEQFHAFYKEQDDAFCDEVQDSLIQQILEIQSRRGNSYITDPKSIPEKETLELVDFLLQSVTEE
ncbi:MAG: exonuclease SbcCD subunit D C-terminal domain-containing protein [Dorea sp.]|nr:exonuclease SbcCD subunit D C-terminal domain-containing protein [Dorea sp.]